MSSYYVRYKRRKDLKWARTDGMSWTKARQVADGLAAAGLEAEVREMNYRQLTAARKAS